MRTASYGVVFLLAAGCLASSRGVIGGPVGTVECLRFKQPLGYSASGARERGNAMWYVLQLADSGRIARPLFPKRQREQWTDLSRWTIKGDTLLIRVSDGLAGWNMALQRRQDEFVGVATYLTDVRVAGWVPPQKDVRAAPIECPAPSA